MKNRSFNHEESIEVNYRSCHCVRYCYRNDCPHVRRRHLIFSRYRYALTVFSWWACLTWILDREMEQEQTVRVVVQIHYISCKQHLVFDKNLDITFAIEA